MSKEIIYIDYDEALNIYGKMIDASDDGFEAQSPGGGRLPHFVGGAGAAPPRADTTADGGGCHR